MILLMWALENGVSYNVSVAPHATTRFIENTVVEIRVPYNTLHTVSIIASQCGQHVSTAVTTLSYILSYFCGIRVIENFFYS